MTPNWSKLEALGRAAVVLFLSTFFGALVFSGGNIPETWAGWKPILGTAIGAALAAEIVWIRSQLAAAASSMGLGTTVASAPTPADDTKAAQRGLVRVGALLMTVAAGVLAVWLAACGLFSQVEPAIQDCGDRVLTDAAKGMTVVQIVEDVGGPCALDAAAVMAIVLASKDPTVTKTKAYAEALRAKASLNSVPVN